jgi:hypothetical protein
MPRRVILKFGRGARYRLKTDPGKFLAVLTLRSALH